MPRWTAKIPTLEIKFILGIGITVWIHEAWNFERHSRSARCLPPRPLASGLGKSRVLRVRLLCTYVSSTWAFILAVHFKVALYISLDLVWMYYDIFCIFPRAIHGSDVP